MLRRRAEAPDRYFTRAELFRLGSGAGDPPPAGWGAPALPLDGCLCVRIPEGFGVDLARAGAEGLASTYVDLSWRSWRRSTTWDCRPRSRPTYCRSRWGSW